MERQSKPTHDNEHQTPTHESPSNTTSSPIHSRNVRTPTTDVNHSDDHHHEPTSSQDESDSPELSLRFPRPVGNTHLANWISTSDPDIMRITSESVNEESGLADSSYELLTHADDTASENESHYENNDESFSESVSSLDQKRSDDVHSVSEDDDEEDVPMLVQAPLPVNDLYMRPVTPIQPHATEDYESEEDESDTNSRSSLEYTHEKLGTPSMGFDETPKASAVWKQQEHKTRQESEPQKFYAAAALLYKLAHDAIVDFYAQIQRDYRAGVTAYQRHGLPGSRMDGKGMLRLACFGLVIPLYLMLGVTLVKFLHFPIYDLIFPASSSDSAVTTLTTTAAPQILATTASSSTPRALTTTRTDLNVREESSALDWIFSRDIGLSYSTVDNSFVVDIPDSIKKEWLAKDCVVVTATREGKEIDTNVEKVEKGVAATLPRRERYGDVDFVVESTCRPTIKQTVTVNFGRYENEFTALARQTKDLVLRVAEDGKSSCARAYDLIHIPSRRDLIPVHSVEKAVKVVSDRLNSANLAAHVSLSQLLAKSTKLTNDVARNVELAQKKTEVMMRDTQTNLQLGLLNSQISAKLWWLKVTRQDADREQYRQKASKYLAEKQDKARSVAVEATELVAA